MTESSNSNVSVVAIIAILILVAGAVYFLAFRGGGGGAADEGLDIDVEINQGLPLEDGPDARTRMVFSESGLGMEVRFL
jgi:hypothetical protein